MNWLFLWNNQHLCSFSALRYSAAHLSPFWDRHCFSPSQGVKCYQMRLPEFMLSLQIWLLRQRIAVIGVRLDFNYPVGGKQPSYDERMQALSGCSYQSLLWKLMRNKRPRGCFQRSLL